MNDANIKKAISLKILCSFIGSLVAALIKLAGPIPVAQKTFIRCLIYLTVSSILINRSRISLKIEKRAIIPLIIRSIFGVLAISFAFYAYQNMKLADATMIMKLGPVFIAVWSLLILHEQVKIRTWVGYGISLLSCLLIIRPSGSSAVQIAAFIALANAIVAGLGGTMLRVLGVQGVNGKTILFYFSLFGLLVTLPFVLCNYTPMDGRQVMILIVEGLLASLFQILNAKCYQYAPGNKISIYSYSQLIFTGIMGYLIFSEIPEMLSILGYLIITGVAVGLYWLDQKEELTRHKRLEFKNTYEKKQANTSPLQDNRPSQNL